MIGWNSTGFEEELSSLIQTTDYIVFGVNSVRDYCCTVYRYSKSTEIVCIVNSIFMFRWKYKFLEHLFEKVTVPELPGDKLKNLLFCDYGIFFSWTTVAAYRFPPYLLNTCTLLLIYEKCKRK